MKLMQIVEDTLDVRCVFYTLHHGISGKFHSVSIYQKYSETHGAENELKSIKSKKSGEIVSFLKLNAISKVIISQIQELMKLGESGVIDFMGKYHKN